MSVGGEECNTEFNSVCQVRMNEFCSHLEPTRVVRPRPSISPINVSACQFPQVSNDSLLVPSDISGSHLSPFVGARSLHYEPSSQMTGSSPFVSLVNKHLLGVHSSLSLPPKMSQFQSTPSKIENSFLSPHNMSGALVNKPTARVNYHSVDDLAKSSDESGLSAVSSSSSFQDTGYASSSSLASFNESLRNYYESMERERESERMESNKENSQSSIEIAKRKPRTAITKQQRAILEWAYSQKAYPDAQEVESLCQVLGFEEGVIRIWFQNKRARNKQNKPAKAYRI